jgi:hypothetical protein
MIATSTDFTRQPEVQFLYGKFSSGVTLRELRSIAIVVSSMAKLKPPSRDEKRNQNRLLQWFIDYWGFISPWLSIINLRDSDDRIIDSVRELREKRVFSILSH